jgi:hypothetical protein
MDWDRFLDKNISQDENYNDVFDDDDDEALVTLFNKLIFIYLPT